MSFGGEYAASKPANYKLAVGLSVGLVGPFLAVGLTCVVLVQVQKLRARYPEKWEKVMGWRKRRRERRQLRLEQEQLQQIENIHMNERQDNNGVDADDTAADTSQGLSEQEIALLLRHKFKASDVTKKSYETDKSCMVCLCDYEEGDALLSLACRHTFHDSCAVSWLRSNARCPLCNAPPFELQVPPIAHIAIDM